MFILLGSHCGWTMCSGCRFSTDVGPEETQRWDSSHLGHQHGPQSAGLWALQGLGLYMHLAQSPGHNGKEAASPSSLNSTEGLRDRLEGDCTWSSLALKCVNFAGDREQLPNRVTSFTTFRTDTSPPSLSHGCWENARYISSELKCEGKRLDQPQHGWERTRLKL